MAGTYSRCIFNFLRICQTLLHSGYTTCPAAMFESSSCSTSTLGIIRIHNFSHSNWCTVVSYCSFILHFPTSFPNDQLHFMFLFAISKSLVKCLFKFFAHFFSGLSSYCSILRVLYVGYKSFIRCVTHVFSLVCSLSFHSFNIAF